MSFWAGGFDDAFATSSAIEEVLSQDEFALEDLLNHEDIIQETKYLNGDLVKYLQKPDVVKKLVSYVIARPPTVEKEAKLESEDVEKMKYHYIASELFACEVIEMLDALFDNQELLRSLFSFLDTPPPLDPSECAYFCKVITVLISKKYAQLVNFIIQTNQLKKILTHIGLDSVKELLIKIGWNNDHVIEEEIDIEWLHKADLVPLLAAKMDPCYDNEPEIHVNASCALIDIVVKNSDITPQLTLLMDDLYSEKILETIFNHMFSGSESSFTNSLSIVIALVKSDTDQRLGDCASSNDIEDSKVDKAKKKVPTQLSPILKFTIKSLPKLIAYLKSPNGLDGIELLTQSGKLDPPLGASRLKIVELVLSMVHSKLEAVDEALTTQKALIIILDLFFKYPWNNLLHKLVETMIDTILDDVEQGETEETYPEKSTKSILKKNMFCEGHILEKISLAFDANAKAIKEPKGCRLGYMGHILRISASIRSCSERKSFEEMGIPKEELEVWEVLVKGQLSKDINEQQEILGGESAVDTRKQNLIGHGTEEKFKALSFDDSTFGKTKSNDTNASFDTNFDDTNFNNTNDSFDANFNDSNFNDSNANDASFDANFDDANFDDANFNDTSFDANFDDANFNDSNVNDSNVNDASFDTNFDDAFNDASFDANFDDAFNDSPFDEGTTTSTSTSTSDPF